VAELSNQIGDVERKLSNERLATERKAAADKLAAQVDDFEHRLPGFLQASHEFTESAQALAPVSFESAEIGAHLRSLAGEIEIAAAFVIADMRNAVLAVLSGDRPIPREPAEVVELIPPAVNAPPTEECVPMFCVHGCKWRAADGTQTFGPQYEDIELPKRLLARASARGAIVRMDDPRRKQLRGVRGGAMRIDAPDVIDLDAEPQEPEAETSASTEFTEIDRGPDRVLRIVP